MAQQVVPEFQQHLPVLAGIRIGNGRNI